MLACATAIRSVLPDPERPGRVLRTVERLERTERLDPVLHTLRRVVRALPLGDARDALHGRWLGHPVHPLLVQVPIGTWMSAAVLDLVPGQRHTAGLLVGTGLVAAVPAAVSGWADWAELREPQLRVGVVHAATNTLAVGLYAASLAARLRGRPLRGRALGYAGLTAVGVARRGRALGYAGLTAVGVGGALGGHLAYRQAASVNHAEDIRVRTEPGWHPLGAVAEFPVDEPVRRSVGGTPVVVVRESVGTSASASDGNGNGEVRVLAERCSHMAGPLAQGTVSDGCLRCPWHGSVFRLSDGWNVGGPATAPQPAFETRYAGGRVEARLNP